MTPIYVGVCGPIGAGKTYLADAMVTHINSQNHYGRRVALADPLCINTLIESTSDVSGYIFVDDVRFPDEADAMDYVIYVDLDFPPSDESTVHSSESHQRVLADRADLYVVREGESYRCHGLNMSPRAVAEVVLENT